ncbi:hypothetical protein NLI96_g8750 [Meripilus lineatus]|uniref:Uncharacterized protein n=1 Tax=Meripilus lineatus TaxID=2056292 RepID=A0AAD5UZ25_9APHY|nr:hypothetical protein NLI96_g8750 [Physisporinus lineatus]
MATQTRKQTKTKTKNTQPAHPPLRGLSDDDSLNERDEDRNTGRTPPRLPPLSLSTPKVIREDSPATPGGSTPPVMASLPPTTPRLITAQWTAPPTVTCGGSGDQIKKEDNEGGPSQEIGDQRMSRNIPSHRMYRQQMEAAFNNLRERLNRFSKETNNALDEMMSNITENTQRMDDGLEPVEYKAATSSPSTWTQAITPVTEERSTGAAMIPIEPVVDAAEWSRRGSRKLIKRRTTGTTRATRTTTEGDKEKSASEKSDKEDVASDYRGSEGSDEESESSYGGSQYDSDESMYYAEEDYEGYGSSDEEPEYFRAITIASWRGESEDESEAGPSNQEDMEPEEAVVEPAVTGIETGVLGDDTQEDELPELEEIEEDQSDASGSTEIARVQQGSVGQFWRTEYSRVNNLLEQEEQANLRLRQRIREVEMKNRGLESRIWEMGEEIRILWRSHAPDVPAELARDVLHNSMWREIVRGSPGLQGDLQDEFEGQGEPPAAGDNERRMMNAEREAQISREEERQRAINDTIVEEMMRAMGPERDREYRTAIAPKAGT